MIDPNQMATIQQKLRDSLKVIQMYKWLLDSYVLVSAFHCLKSPTNQK